MNAALEATPVAQTTPHVQWSEARPWHTNAALILFGLTLFCLSRQFLAEYDNFLFGFDGISGASAVIYLVASWLVLTKPVDRHTLPIIITVACACRLAVLYSDPFTSSDIYRYVWDGVVQHVHISPYRYVPGDPALTFLREPNSELFNNMNRRDYARTIYPPAAQFFFYLVTFFAPTVTCMKTFMVLAEGVTAWGLIKLLKRIGYRREQVLLYAWSPMLIWEIGGAGHLDALAMALITLALLARYNLKPALVGLLLGLAVITKMYPLILFPALYRRGDWKMPASLAAVVLFGYACYSSAGMLVFGFLGEYTKEEGMRTGARYFLLDLAQHVPGFHHLPVAAFYLLCAAVFSTITLWAWRSGAPSLPGAVSPVRVGSLPSIRPFRLSRSDFLRGQASFLPPAYALAAALMFLFSPHYPWYIAWLFPFFCLMPSLPMATYLMAFFYGFTTYLAAPGPKMFILNERIYAVTLFAFAIHMALRSWPLYRQNFLASREAGTSNSQLSPSTCDFQPHPEPTR